MKRLLVVIFLLFTTVITPSLLAQDGNTDKSTPIDSYPLPAQPGAVRYTLADQWNKTNLTFSILNCPSTIDCNRAYGAVRAAFEAWGEVSNLSFTEVSGNNADILVQWTVNEEEFGRPGGTLGFAYYPSYGGDIYLDDAEPWTIFDGGPTDLYVVIAHEIGHSIGLDHSNDEHALMYAYSGVASNLTADDINGVQRLYGAPSDAGGAAPQTPPQPPAPENVPSGPVEVVEGSIDDSVFYQVWTIDVSAGETITFKMEALNGDLDPYLAILTPDSQTVLVEDDDSLGNRNALITYTFPDAGTYIVVATRYLTNDGDSAGSYRLTAERGQASAGQPPQAPPTQPPSAPTTASIAVANQSGVTVCYIYISPNDETTWGSDWLDPDETLESGFFIRWDGLATGIYDVRVQDCQGGYLESYYVEFDSDTTIYVYTDRLEVAAGVP